MKRWIPVFLLPLLRCAPSDEADLRALLEFLALAQRSRGARAVLGRGPVYTSSGEADGKADILRDVRDPRPRTSRLSPTAEDVQVRLYGKAAVVAFRLVSAPQQYFNTGTFVNRNGQWQAVAWQATKIPPATAP
jgi:hypothetical protein